MDGGARAVRIASGSRSWRGAGPSGGRAPLIRRTGAGGVRLVGSGWYNRVTMQQFLQLSLAATIELAALVLLSRFLFGAFYARPARGLGRLALELFRLPGNLLHEASHAAALFVCGFRVRQFVPSFLDRNGSGYCVAQGRWHRVVPAGLGLAAAGAAPLAAGIAALVAIAQWLGLSEGGQAGSTLGAMVAGRAVAIIRQLDFHAWTTWLALWLAASVAAELAPSDVDFRAGGRPAAVLAGLFIAAGLGVHAWAPEQVVKAFSSRVSAGLSALLRAADLALVVAVVAGALVWLPVAAVGQRSAAAGRDAAGRRRAIRAGKGRRAAVDRAAASGYKGLSRRRTAAGRSAGKWPGAGRTGS